MLAKILHALIDDANVTDNLRGELHSLADLLDTKLADLISWFEAPPADAPADAAPDVSRETVPAEASPAGPAADVSRETAPADDASGA